MKIVPKDTPELEAVEWHPEMDGDKPKWGPAMHGLHQASDDGGAIGIHTVGKKKYQVHDGDFLILNAGGGIVEILEPAAFHAKYEAVAGDAG